MLIWQKLLIKTAGLIGVSALLTACQPSADGSQNDTKQTSATSRLAAPLCDNKKIAQSFQSKRSDVQVRGCGTVKAVLKDDLSGSRHQKFIVTLDKQAQTGKQTQTVLVAHNIDLAPRVAGLKKGDWVDFYGEYEYNEQGGVVHWTHKDPAARRQDGYIEHQGRRYD